MRERIPTEAAHISTSKHKLAAERLVLGGAAPPSLQALTLTSLSGAEKLRLKTPAGSKLSDSKRNISSRTVHVIKASQSVPAGDSGSDAASAGNVLHASRQTVISPHTRQDHMQDSKAWRQNRILQDAGLQVSAAKVNHRQSSDLTHKTSPYSGRVTDAETPYKRKGIARSASFALGSEVGALRRRQYTVNATTGVRPGSAPASGNGALQQAAADRQPLQRRQLSGQQLTTDPPVYALPGFRAGSCLSADTRLGRNKQGQRPGTPNIKSDGASAVRSTSAAVAAYERLHKAAPVRQLLCVPPNSAAAAAYKTAAAIGSQLPTTAQPVRETRQVGMSGLTGNTHVSADLSDSDDSSWSLLNSDSSAESCSLALTSHKDVQQDSVQQDSVQLKHCPSGTVSRRQLQVTEALQQTQPSSSASGTDIPLHLPAANETHGNTAKNPVACHTTSRAYTASSAGQHGFHDPLMVQSTEIMHWLGIDDAWFEHTLLPFAEQLLQPAV